MNIDKVMSQHSITQCLSLDVNEVVQLHGPELHFKSLKELGYKSRLSRDDEEPLCCCGCLKTNENHIR